jgi:hypothetical protein
LEQFACPLPPALSYIQKNEKIFLTKLASTGKARREGKKTRRFGRITLSAEMSAENKI